MPPSASSSRASTSDGVVVRAGTLATTYSWVAVKNIHWMAPRRAWDNSPEEVSEEVLCRRGSATGSTGFGGGGTGAKGIGTGTQLWGLGMFVQQLAKPRHG
ncbi:UNVERIFIED_CONTAM: hypothetical protein Sradi_4386200 [Sesamum radiatum]|uniref:Uncharacterized protein n=1 Tax=Sesamum radiatum TaxID=300843 RepID=A0AAW2NSK3_SESRA